MRSNYLVVYAVDSFGFFDVGFANDGSRSDPVKQQVPTLKEVAEKYGFYGQVRLRPTPRALLYHEGVPLTAGHHPAGRI